MKWRHGWQEPNDAEKAVGDQDRYCKRRALVQDRPFVAAEELEGDGIPDVIMEACLLSVQGEMIHCSHILLEAVVMGRGPSER